MKILSILFICSLAISGPALADYNEVKELVIPAEKIQGLEIDCGAGYLEIEGVEGLENIEVTAEIVIEGISRKKAERYIEDHMNLELTKKGKYARLKSNFDNHSFSFFSIFSISSAAINLTVRMPKNIELEIDDGSGYIEIKDIEKDIIIDDGSGYIEINNIIGHLDIDDGSGDIDITQVIGNIYIDDGSGSMDIRDITGNIEIDDGSGNITVKLVDGNVVVDDGSGNIRIDRISEDVAIIDDGSGRCSITNVEGEVDRH